MTGKKFLSCQVLRINSAVSVKLPLNVFLVLLLIGGMLLIGFSTVSPVTAQEKFGNDGITEYHIGALLPFSGVLESYAENSFAAANLAVDDVNAWLEEEEKEWRLRMSAEDTELNHEVALAKMEAMHGEGIKFFVGPMASGEASGCLDYANANEVLYISPSATSPGLAIEGDWFYRFVADDSLQGIAISALVEDAELDHIIFGWRGDHWGDGLQAAVADSLPAGVAVYSEEIRYDSEEADFAELAADLDSFISDLVGQGYSLEKIGFNLIAFDEAALFLKEAAAYPQLKNIIWIGSDGTARSNAIAMNPIAAAFAAEVEFLSPAFRFYELGEHSNFYRLRQHIIDTLGREPDDYSYNTYDIVWALAHSIDEEGYDTNKVKAALPGIVDYWSKVYGASGHVVLNDAGDRAFADYNYWLLTSDKIWEVVGYYDGAEKEVRRDYGPVVSVKVNAAPASPTVPGEEITFTAMADGGIDPVEYAFYYRLPGSSQWKPVGDFSSENNLKASPTAEGQYSIGVRVRSGGSNRAFEAESFIIHEVVKQVVEPVDEVTLSVDPASPTAPGEEITFTAEVLGGVNPEYAFYYRPAGTTAWTLARGYSFENTFSASPAAVGDYQVAAVARSAGSEAIYEAYDIKGHTIAIPPVETVSLTADPPSPSAPGTSITFTAEAEGGLNPKYAFYYRVKDSGPWVLARAYSTVNTFASTVNAVGEFEIAVIARSSGSTASREAYVIISYEIADTR